MPNSLPSHEDHHKPHPSDPIVATNSGHATPQTVKFNELQAPYHRLSDMGLRTDRSIEHYAGDSTIWLVFTPILRESTLGEDQGSPTSHPLPRTSQEDLRLDGCLEYPMPRRHYTFTNIHVFTGIRTQALRHVKSVEAQTASRWYGMEVRRGSHDSKLRGPSPKAL
ncbi:hypothetical protein TNCV_1833431 [Trichonephila clavipes]|nr:hypothetical protein TNCV_1833431 [Trichonephila clavipes]